MGTKKKPVKIPLNEKLAFLATYHRTVLPLCDIFSKGHLSLEVKHFVKSAREKFSYSSAYTDYDLFASFNRIYRNNEYEIFRNPKESQ